MSAKHVFLQDSVYYFLIVSLKDGNKNRLVISYLGSHAECDCIKTNDSIWTLITFNGTCVVQSEWNTKFKGSIKNSNSC